MLVGTWSIKWDPSGVVSQKDQLRIYTSKNGRILAHWIPSRLLTASACGKSLIQLPLISREIQSETKLAVDG